MYENVKVNYHTWIFRVFCGVGELAAVKQSFAKAQASTQEEGEIFQLLKDLFLQICHHGEFLVRKNGARWRSFFVNRIFWGDRLSSNA